MLPELAADAVESSNRIHLSMGSSALGSSSTITALVSAEVFYRLSERLAISRQSPVITLSDPEKIPSAMEKHAVDLVLLDLMLPRKDGFEVLAELRPLDGTGALIEGHLALHRGDREVAAEWFAAAAEPDETGRDRRTVVEALVGLAASTSSVPDASEGATSTSTNCRFRMVSAVAPSSGRLKAMMPPKADVGSVLNAFS
mgnify:CR=1 FL=1